MDTDILPGQSYPLGATVSEEGVNFSLFSKNCTAVELLLFEAVDSKAPSRVIYLDTSVNRTFYYWHAQVNGLQAGQLYGYRICGPFAPERGLRFDGKKVLLDPYSYAIAVGGNYQRMAAIHSGSNIAHCMKSVVVDPQAYDWEGDTYLRKPFSSSLIYELHVRGFTRHPNSGLEPQKRGTYAGLVEKVPYLQSLGVTTVELMPAQQYDEQDAPDGLSNYWGYSPVIFFAPHAGYSSRQDPLGPVEEFRGMVKALHRAGIEVILDVVFNHTSEGNQSGPLLSFRGLENRAYYILEPGNPARYADYTGCGNTVNANHSIVRRMIMDCLRYWVKYMHVDGFRFDLASVLSRDQYGSPLSDPPILWEIESDPVLAGTKIIAEAWDAAGLYQVGSFIGHRWAEWNGQFRDDVRRFVKGDPGSVERLSRRICGSRDLYPQPDREPNRSINFVTCHDGFTLNDLVSYNDKHNERNGCQNLDGLDANFSWNCGAEGPSADAEVEGLRLRQIKNFFTILLVSQGTPMISMGDEVRRTQWGNNNAYCQDNEGSWFDWDQVDRYSGLLRFVRCLVRFTQENCLFQEEQFWEEPGSPDIVWHGVRLGQPDWSCNSHSLTFELRFPEKHEHLHVMLNAYWEPLVFDLPSLPPGKSWLRVLDTSLPSPDDFSDPWLPLPNDQTRYKVCPRTAVILSASE
jgi:isoamylase